MHLARWDPLKDPIGVIDAFALVIPALRDQQEYQGVYVLVSNEGKLLAAGDGARSAP